MFRVQPGPSAPIEDFDRFLQLDLPATLTAALKRGGALAGLGTYMADVLGVLKASLAAAKTVDPTVGGWQERLAHQTQVDKLFANMMHVDYRNQLWGAWDEHGQFSTAEQFVLPMPDRTARCPL